MGKEYDFIVVGQGIAGTCLTSELQRLNKSVLVIDSSELPSASHVAGGLFNPVTGRAMVLTWMATTLFPFLDEFYSALEKSLGARFLHFLPLFRPFTNTEELNEWQGRLSQEKFKPFIDRIDTFPVYDELVNNPFGGVTLKHTGYVNTAVMLKAFRDKLIASANLLDEKFIYDELNFKSSKVVYKGNIAGKIIFANGPLGFDNEWVEKIRFQALKGEVLQLKMDVNSQVILNRNGFVLPRNGSHIAGSNYDKNGKDWEPTEKAQSEIKERIDKFLKAEYKITGQKAGLRPTTHDRRPVMGMHPDNPSVGIFNGLGTKGVSLAPYFARQFAEHLVLGSEIDKEVRIGRYFS